MFFPEDKEMQELSIKTNLSSIDLNAAELAHEIRNPLTTIKALIQLLKPHLMEIGKEQVANIALDEINRANELICEFLNTTKLKATNKTGIPANKIVRDIANMFASENLIHDVQIDVTLSDSDPIILVNENQIKQVLINMIRNSIEAILICPNESLGRISLSLETINSSVFIIITDNGCGISQDTMDELCMPFFSTKETGTGIGLSICKKIIDEHNGKIHMSSLYGKGTVFKVELPLFR